MKVSQEDTCNLNFDILWMKVENETYKKGGGDVALITRDQLKDFSRSMYSQGWKDHISFEEKKNGVLTKISKQ